MTEMYLTVSLVVLVNVMLASADTPANCTYDDIVGKWIFYEGPRGQNLRVNCSALQGSTLTHRLHLELLFPNVAIDEFGNEGKWTVIYNQGFEVSLNYRTYFAFSNYTTLEHHKVISHCHSTLPGWAHDIYIRDWSCFVGKKVDLTSGYVEKSLSEPGLKHGHKLHDTVVRSDLHSVRRLQRHKFQQDHEQIAEINAKQRSWTAGENSVFEGKSLHEVLGYFGGLKSRVSGPAPLWADRVGRLASYHELHAIATLPESIDWRNRSNTNYVSPVRNQGSCGSCYAFASAAMLEARVRVQSNNTRTPVFSPQDVVQCSEYSQGCTGGFPYLVAGKYGQDFGMVLESCNPYTLPEPEEGVCNTAKSCRRFYTTNYDYVGGYYGACNEDLMALAVVLHGPVAVGFEVYDDFAHYTGGIYHHTGVESGRNRWRRHLQTRADFELHKWDPFQLTNHAVLVVGYGVERGTGEKYWIVKNSWSQNWGEGGYFRIRKGTDECGIESLAVEATPIPTY